ncbi:MAG: hypothetical protein JO197_01435 [Acidobacteria bacterium]|nr:hypothetical protein [Acidobacteriota bacterium]MBV9476222.1 hypothetical protein [Acidobacteriota bacterium]
MKRSLKLGTAFLFTLSIAAPLFAGDTAREIARPTAGGSSIQWQANASGVDHYQLIVVTPNHDTFSRDFAAGTTPSFRLQDMAGKPIADGAYHYELRAMPQVSASVRQQLIDARANNDDEAIHRIITANGLGNPAVQSGTFTVVNGSILDPNMQEPVSRGPQRPIASNGSGTTAPASGNASHPSLTPVVNDNVIADDLIVQGSGCFGFDCVNNESFGFDTIRLKENNLRINFDDTSTSAGYPNVSWSLTANDTTSGGANRFSIDDVTNSKTILNIEAASPTNSIYIDSTGKIGFRNSNPLLDLHITTGDTPAIRFEQTNSSGFTAQTWDIGANEANWFVRDLTGGSKLPLRVRPGAPTSSIDIAASGNVGIGTASPSQWVHAYKDVDANLISLIENPSTTGTSANAAFQAKSDTATVSFQAHSSARTLSRFGKTLGGWAEFLGSAGNGLIVGTANATNLVLGTNSTNRLEIGATGGVTVTGNFTVTGGTKNFAVVDPADSKKAIYYAALEGPEAGTYYRGTAKTVDGKVVIQLPGYFSRITETERMTVQITPVGAPGQLYVAEKTPEKVVIKVADGAPDAEFDYFVQGIRKGYLDFEVERENNLPK